MEMPHLLSNDRTSKLTNAGEDIALLRASDEDLATSFIMPVKTNVKYKPTLFYTVQQHCTEMHFSLC